MSREATAEHKRLGNITDGERTFERRRARMWVLCVVLLTAAISVLAMDILDTGHIDSSAKSKLNGPGAIALVATLVGITMVTKRTTVTIFAPKQAVSGGEIVGWVVAAGAAGLAIVLGYVDATRGDSKHLLADWPTAWPAIALVLLVVVLTLVVFVGWAARGPTLSWASAVAVLAGLVTWSRIEAWQWWGVAVVLVVVGVIAVVSAWKWRATYARNHLLVLGSSVGFPLLVAGSALLCTSNSTGMVTSGSLAWGVIGFGILIVALGWLGGEKFDIRVFGVSTGILIGLAGVWMQLSRPSSGGGTDPGLMWWAYGAWFLAMSMATLYIRNRSDEPETDRLTDAALSPPVDVQGP
jgi:hypothetical protein